MFRAAAVALLLSCASASAEDLEFFVQPLGAFVRTPLVSDPRFLSQPELCFRAPMGMRLPTERGSWTFEFTPGHCAHEIWAFEHETRLTQSTLLLSVGRELSVEESRFFVAPKVFVVGMAGEIQHTGMDASLVNTTAAQISVGVDFGYRYSIEPVVLTFVLGVSAGVVLSPDSVRPSATAPSLVTPGTYSAPAIALTGDLNLNLLRLGFAF